MQQAEPILVVEDIHHAFGGVQAVNGCSFRLPPGMVCGLIGPNGAGKTTLVNAVTGMVRPQRGRVVYAGTEITRWPPDRVARAGLLRTFQLSREFTQMTVLENLLVAATGQIDESLWGALVHRRAIRARERELVSRARRVLGTFGLEASRNEWAENLSGGQKRLLELARAVMAGPKLLLMDEPMAGINPALIDQIETHIRDLCTGGISFLIVEHNLQVVERLCDLVVVMAEGRTLAQGAMSEHRQNPEVVRAYLGSAGGGRVL